MSNMAKNLVKTSSVLKVGQLLEVGIFGELETYKSRVEDINDDSIVIDMPFDSRKIPVIPTAGSRVQTKIIADTCAFRFTSNYISSGMNPIPVWTISKPPVVERFQNREFVRVKITRPIVVRVVDEDGTMQPMVTTNTVDISGGGLCFVMFNVIKIGTRVNMKMDNLPHIELLSLMGEVVRCHEVDVSGIKVYHVGVKFIDFPRQDQNKLIRFLFQMQRKSLALGL